MGSLSILTRFPILSDSTEHLSDFHYTCGGRDVKRFPKYASSADFWAKRTSPYWAEHALSVGVVKCHYYVEDWALFCGVG
jgi:hypothetical protein